MRHPLGRQQPTLETFPLEKKIPISLSQPRPLLYPSTPIDCEQNLKRSDKLRLVPRPASSFSPKLHVTGDKARWSLVWIVPMSTTPRERSKREPSRSHVARGRRGDHPRTFPTLSISPASRPRSLANRLRLTRRHLGIFCNPTTSWLRGIYTCWRYRLSSDAYTRPSPPWIWPSSLVGTMLSSIVPEPSGRGAPRAEAVFPCPTDSPLHGDVEFLLMDLFEGCEQLPERSLLW